MASLFEIGVTNAVIASVLAIVVWVVTRVWRQPAVAQLLWVLVLLKLVTPPMVSIPWHFNTPFAIVNSAPHIVVDPLADIPIKEHTARVPIEAQIPKELGEDALLITARSFDAAQATRLEAGSFDRRGDAIATDYARTIWIPALMSIWLAGSVIWICVALVRLMRFHVALRNTSACPDSVCRLANEAAARLGVSSGFQLRTTDARVSPLVWPIGRPTIVLSNPLLAELSQEEIKTLLAHELAHLRRKDHWLRWFELLVTAAYWWHPVVWWARRMIERAEEQACDAWVVWAFPDSAKRYGSALFKVVQMASQHRQRAPLIASRLGSTGNLKERIEDIMNATWKRNLTMRAGVVVAIAALSILPLSFQAVTAVGEQSADSNKDNPATGAATTSASPLHNTTSVTGIITTATPGATHADAKVDSEEIDALREHVKFLEEQFKKQDALYNTGSRGGSADKRSITGYELAVAQADLAVAEGNRDKAIAFCEQAEKFADESLKNVAASFEAGRMPLESLLQTARSVTESKRRLARIRRESEAPPTSARPLERSVAMSELAQLASSSGPTPSIGMLKKRVAQNKEDYDRLAKLAQDKLVSASDLAKSKMEYEYSLESLQQAQHTVEYRKALVELANAEYEQAVAANKQAPNAISEFEMRRLKIMVTLAEAKLKEVAE